MGNLGVVLIIDDSKMARRVVADILSSMGVDCLHASNGQEGLDIVASRDDIDLVLSDVHMPVIDGLEFLENVKLLNQSKPVPVVMLTNESDPIYQMEAKKLGAKGWIPKPADAAAIQKVYAKLVSTP